MVKWWDRFWGAVWMVGSGVIAYLTARWFATNAAPADLGGLRYGLIAFAGLFGLLVGALLLSIATIGIMSAVEGLLARAGRPVRRPEPPNGGLRLRQPDPAPEAARAADDEDPASALASSGHD